MGKLIIQSFDDMISRRGASNCKLSQFLEDTQKWQGLEKAKALAEVGGQGSNRTGIHYQVLKVG